MNLAITHASKPTNPLFVDIEGRRFGKLVVVSYAGMFKTKGKWHCQCDCGNTTTTVGADLRQGLSKSCGCGRKAGAIAAGKANRRHGLTATPTYWSWQSMLARCDNQSHKSFAGYGGRGITICAAWRNFDSFLADMGERPIGMTLERKDTNGNYEPDNCCWATHTAQARNRRSNRQVTCWGETKTIVEWSEDSRCVPSHVTLRKRVEMGWTALDAITRQVAAHTRQAASF